MGGGKHEHNQGHSCGRTARTRCAGRLARWHRSQIPTPLAREAADDNMSPEEIAKLLAVMDQLEPLELTDAERAAWEAERQARKTWEKAHFAEQANKLQSMWE